MKSFNKVVLMGRLTRDPEVKTVPSGQVVCGMGVALNRSYKDKNGEWVENTDFVDVSIWGERAERVAEKAHKGSNVLVEGELRSRSWESETGKQTRMEVHADEVIVTDPVVEQ